ncbi:MAG: hypothetical protein ACK5MU_03515 [Candidatus Saccharimonadales bacterium]
MEKVIKALGIAAIATISILGVAAPLHATSYDANTNVMDVTGMGTDALEGFEVEDNTAFLGDTADIAANGLTIRGTLDEVRAALVALHDYIAATSPSYAEIKAALGATPDFTIELTADAVLTDEDVAYINFFAGYVEASTPTANIVSESEVDLTGLTDAANTHADFTFGTVSIETIVATDVAQLAGLGITWTDGQIFDLVDGIFSWDENESDFVAVPAGDPADETPEVTAPADVDAKA